MISLCLTFKMCKDSISNTLLHGASKQGLKVLLTSPNHHHNKSLDRRRIWKEKNVSMLKWYANDMQERGCDADETQGSRAGCAAVASCSVTGRTKPN